MTRNKIKAEYASSVTTHWMNTGPFADWMFGVMKEDVQQWVRFSTDNKALFTSAFGKAHFHWRDSDRRDNACWRFDIGDGFFAYVFTGERGTSLELARGAKDADSSQWLAANHALVVFVKTKIFPVVNRSQSHDASCSDSGVERG